VRATLGEQPRRVSADRGIFLAIVCRTHALSEQTDHHVLSRDARTTRRIGFGTMRIWRLHFRPRVVTRSMRMMWKPNGVLGPRGLAGLRANGRRRDAPSSSEGRRACSSPRSAPKVLGRASIDSLFGDALDSPPALISAWSESGLGARRGGERLGRRLRCDDHLAATRIVSGRRCMAAAVLVAFEPSRTRDSGTIAAGSLVQPGAMSSARAR